MLIAFIIAMPIVFFFGAWFGNRNRQFSIEASDLLDLLRLDGVLK